MVTRLRKNSPHKAAEVRPAAESGASETTVKPGLRKLLESTTHIIGYLSVIMLVMAVAYKVLDDIRDRPILIDPLTVPAAMEEEGYTGLVAANRVADKIRRIEEETKTLARKDDILQASSEPTLLDIEIPETELSLSSAIGLLESLLHFAPRHVSAELIFTSQSEWHEANVTAGHAGCTAVYADPSYTGSDALRVVISVRMPGKSCWTEVMVQSPDDAVVRTAYEVLEMTDPYVLGMYVYEKKHHVASALGLIQEASERDPRNPLYYIGWGSIFEKDGKPDEAVAKYKQALAADPDYAPAYYNWANVLASQGKPGEAITEYQEALRLNPSLAWAHNNMGSALDAEGRHYAAIAQYKEALRLKPDFADADYNLGSALDAEGQHDGAIAAYREAIRLIPDFAWAHNNLGLALDSDGQHEAAITEFKEAIRLKPDLAEAHNNLGSALDAAGRHDEAIAEYQEAIRYNPEFAEAHNNLGLGLDAENQHDSAIAEFKEAIRLRPDYAEAHNNLGSALGEEGQYDAAIAEFKEAIRLKPGYTDAQSNLGIALSAKASTPPPISGAGKPGGTNPI